MFSVILYGRNDTHGYNLHKRAAISFNALAEVMSDPDDEILFVDYNTPDDHPTFPEAIHDTLTEKAKKVLASPDIDDEVFGTTTIMHLRKNQSFCRKQTAHPQAKVESSTYHLVVVDEAQDADATTVRKSIHPMLVATAGTIV